MHAMLARYNFIYMQIRLHFNWKRNGCHAEITGFLFFSIYFGKQIKYFKSPHDSQLVY